ncbi:hypothetical protein I302_107539 [Kwoniella bestiolae CBS 10118]|uniref:Uncharacterized protein n=1 Tax=Kwoniella bestiolae CBS 10118 TaxID=1296100 RepID=A0A1B9FY87_9TREE|nr:hypothetical protein I302_06720 [Kwoniella bestiolae CBS 10118]OCF23736.1 hypothetical protein I302_06720 [Kwoniella bestiolae CBS 10118]
MTGSSDANDINDTFSQATTLNGNAGYASPERPRFTLPDDQSRATQALTTTTALGTGTVATIGAGHSHMTQPSSAYRTRPFSGYQSGTECASDIACAFVTASITAGAAFAALTACLARGNDCSNPY